MKRTIIFFALLCAAVVRADLVMQQQITVATNSTVATIKIKGSKIRLDMYAGQPRAISRITDLNTGEIIILLENQKMFVKTSGQPMKPAGVSGSASQAPVPRPTGKTQKVGSYDTELYAWSNPRGITGTAWLAKNFPDYARIQTDLAVLDKSAAAANNNTDPELSRLPGMVVRSQVTGDGQTITLALISAKEVPLDASLFTIPRDYKEVPRLTPLKQVAAPAAPSTPAAASPPKTTTAPAKTSAKPLPSW